METYHLNLYFFIVFKCSSMCAKLRSTHNCRVNSLPALSWLLKRDQSFCLIFVSVLHNSVMFEEKSVSILPNGSSLLRSEERRVGKECISRKSMYDQVKKGNED